MKELSILIPVYNDDVVVQVSELQRQCQAMRELAWEIIVCDDGSTDDSADNNKAIEEISGCRLILRERNHGRASTRNYLARVAKYDTLLYIDSGLMPNPRFVENYVDNIGRASVVCGNIEVSPESIDMTNLRCKNELNAQRRFTAAKHSKAPYKNFHTTAFMIDRRVMLSNPMREDIKTYGYEDTLFGKQLADRRNSIVHIDNPVLFVRFESNERYLEKTKEAMHTLYIYRSELKGYSGVLKVVEKLKKMHLLWSLLLINRLFFNKIVDNLKGERPNLMLYSVYRMCLLADKMAEKK